MPFTEGDRVRHRGEGVEGVVSNTGYTPPMFMVEWDDGCNTLESRTTVEKVERGESVE